MPCALLAEQTTTVATACVCVCVHVGVCGVHVGVCVWECVNVHDKQRNQ